MFDQITSWLTNKKTPLLILFGLTTIQVIAWQLFLGFAWSDDLLPSADGWMISGANFYYTLSDLHLYQAVICFVLLGLFVLNDIGLVRALRWIAITFLSGLAVLSVFSKGRAIQYMRSTYVYGDIIVSEKWTIAFDVLALVTVVVVVSGMILFRSRDSDRSP